MCVELGSVHQNPHRPVADFGRVDPLRLTPVDDVSITVLADNSIDILSDDRGPTRLPRLGVGPTLHSRGVMGESLPDMLVAEHGLSLLVTYQRQDRDHTILFDSGVSPHGVIENMRRLDIDVRDIETIVCSHGHFDHMGGLHGICQAQKRTDLPVVLHPDFWLRRRQFLPGRILWSCPPLAAPRWPRPAWTSWSPAVHRSCSTMLS